MKEYAEPIHKTVKKFWHEDGVISQAAASMRFNSSRYQVIPATVWSIIDTDHGNLVVLEVVSQEYVVFLCGKLNEGVSLEEIYSRPAPDNEFRTWLLNL